MDNVACRARVNRDTEGASLGVSIALSSDELRELGVDPDETAEVEYVVEDGELQLRKPNLEASTPTP